MLYHLKGIYYQQNSIITFRILIPNIFKKIFITKIGEIEITNVKDY